MKPKFNSGELVFNQLMSTPNKGLIENSFIDSDQVLYRFRHLATNTIQIVAETNLTRLKFNPTSDQYLQQVKQLLSAI